MKKLGHWHILGSFLAVGLLALLSTNPALAAPCAGTDLQGVVFNDYNADGLRNAGNTEPGLSGAVVTVFSGDGSSASCETLADGSFGIDAPAGGFPVRIEVTLPAGEPWDFLEPGAAGSTQTFFASAATSGLEVGFNAPLDFCQANPDVMATCFLQGDPLFAGSDSADGDSLVAVDYDRTVASSIQLAVGSQVGAVWGLAYQRSSQSLFAAAALRRHAGFGPLGLGGIYRLDFSGGSPPVVSTFVDLGTLGVALGSDPRSQPGEDPPGGGPTGNEPGLDNLTYEEIGKVGLGDIDVEEGAGRLWALSLGDGTLYAMDIGPAAAVPVAATAFPLPTVACVDGVFRPWAVKSYRGRIYIGGVCSNESISPYPAPGGFIDFPNLIGYVYSMDPADGIFSLEVTVPLNYPKGCAGGATGCQWYPWTDLSTAALVATPTFPSHPTPLLSDIEFADDGDMIIGFTDRTGFQYGSASPLPNGSPTDTTVATAFTGGDMLRADYDAGTDTFTLESNGIAGGLAGAGSGNAQGPGGGEYYSASTAGFHFELSQGGYAVLRGSNEFVGSAMDPVTTNSGGLLWMFDKGATPGARADGYTLYDITTPSGFRKAAAVGDVELRCDEAPIEIGNRVWCDADVGDTANGIQDPPGAIGIPDSPLAGVTVDLDCSGGAVTASTMTAADGTYLFSDTNVPGGIPPSASCTISIDTAAAGNAAAMGSCVLPAPADVGSPGDPGQDLRDSDGSDLGAGVVGATIVTGGPGSNRHSVDLGFAAPAQADLSITKTDGTTSAVPGGTVTYTIVVTNSGPGSDPAVTVTDTFPAGLTCSYTSMASGGATGNTSGSGNIADTLSMPAGSTVTYDAVCAIDESATGTLSNTATVSGSSPDPNPGNESATDGDTSLFPEADLSVVKSDSVDPADFGASLTYTIEVTNFGPSEATSVVIVDTLPAETTFLSADGSGWSCNELAGVVTCTLPTLSVGSSATPITIMALAPESETTLTNQVSVSSAATDPNTANDNWQEPTRVTGAVVEVPTIGFWGMTMLIALLLGVALFNLRYRL